MSAPVQCRNPVDVSAIDGVHLVRPSGRWSSADVDALSAAVFTRAEAAYPIVVDLSEVSAIDAGVARSLRRAHAAFARNGVRFCVAAATGQPLEVLRVRGLAKDLGADQTVVEVMADVRAVPEAAIGSLGVTVHNLLAEASLLDAGDARRRRLEDRAIEVALPLARTLARRYRHLPEPLDDLEQVAAVGIVSAVRRYDPTHGSGFTAYAVPTVLGELRRYLRDFGWTVRPPRRLQEIRTEVIAASSDVAQRIGREPTAADLAAHTGTRVADVENALAATSGLRPASLDAPVTGGAEQPLYAVIGAPDPDIELVDFRFSIRPLIAALPAHIREILVLRFETELTQAQIAARLGTSQMNVSRILRSTLAGFRRTLLVDG